MYEEQKRSNNIVRSMKNNFQAGGGGDRVRERILKTKAVYYFIMAYLLKTLCIEHHNVCSFAVYV